ncbi:putative signal peptidase I [Aspergillus fischeri NRRL 181]|uniref:Signal peptidase complex catalytic subunit SEC11 n=1 Tax=Neosartorya fischeri (strain ATCC 1020 / DSM 3700 / CBS 544.65 / FGSC A1164 / JCM 1740 / NRRL 181 / WB 181) TaxID=331117 RepID=A1D2V3_NEOFI|nr:signal peptidase I, putative [Aspergillus fischeri NRRL 181]EAW22746.1 signal peptidase I, putative [Aspergillus fischeri NRRL 181]
MDLRRFCAQLLSLVVTLSTLFMIWKGTNVITGSAYPLMVVTSGSMEPAFYRGDLVFLWDRQERIRAGDIPVVWFEGRELPMVHRAIQVSYEVLDGENNLKQHILTKGDNNALDDSSLYPAGQGFVYRENVVGLVRGYVPYVGWLSLLVKDVPWIPVGLLIVGVAF